MKRFLVCLLTLALLIGAMVTVASAADYEEDASALTSVQLKPLFIVSGVDIYSDLAEDYYGWWWEEEEGVDYMDNLYFDPAFVNLRGFGMSADGMYAYLGALNGGDGLRGVSVLHIASGVVTDFYYHADVYPEGKTPSQGQGPFSYSKGIDADGRGYVYVGFTFSDNYNVVNLGIAKQESDGTLTEVSCVPVWENGVHGDTSGTHVGINGVDVITMGEKTYCYVVVNYDYDALYCFDVTDPAKPVLNEEFGEGGFINFSDSECAVAVEGKSIKELQYLDVDEDGTVYLVTEFNGATTGIMTIAPDGSACTNFYEVGGGNIYSTTIVGNFLMCGSKSGAEIFVVDKETGESQGTIVPATDTYGDRITRMVICNDVLYVCDAGNDSSTFNAIYAGALSDEGLTYLQNVIQALNEGEEEETTPEDSAPDSAPESAPETDPESTPVAPVETGASETKPADTTATTEAPAEGGCASLMLSGASVVVLIAAAYVLSKRK